MRPEALDVARGTKGFMPEDEGRALHRAGLKAATSGLGPLVEIGTYCGKSSVYLGEAARLGGATLFTVDHHRGSEENQAGWQHHDPEVVDGATGLMDTLPWARRTLAAAGLEEDVVVVVGRSVTVARAWTTPLSFVFIDGGHGREVAHADYDAWAPKVAQGGWLAIHDVFPDPADGGRPPYEIFCRAIDSGLFADQPDAGCGSLRVLRRRTKDPSGGPGGGSVGDHEQPEPGA